MIRTLFSLFAPASKAKPSKNFDNDALLNAMGPYVVHCAAKENVPSILQNGLHSAAYLANLANEDPKDIILREQRLSLKWDAGQARLNDQKPFLNGLRNAANALDGHSVETWAHQLDKRIFLWPGRADEAFAKSVDNAVQLKTMFFDSEKLIAQFADTLWLCPLNSGSFVRKPSPRGDWIYVPASAGWDVYRTNRLQRGLVKTADTKIRELSLTSSISSAVLSEILVKIE